MTRVQTSATSIFIMNQDASSRSRQSPTGVHSSDSGSQSKPPSKRASRAGTRSVSTLSAAQLERKRANDREAQRAIRQRTKDHIETLERRISELTGTQEAREKLFLATQQRNRELEEENIYLRNRLSGDSFAINVNDNDGTCFKDLCWTFSLTLTPEKLPQYSVSAPETSPQTHLSAGVNIARPSSSATSRSIPQSAEAWRQHNQYSPGSAPSTASFMPEAAQHGAGQNAASWRAQDVPAPAYGYQVRQGDRSSNYSSPAHQMSYPGHSQAAQFQQAINAQTSTPAPVTPGFHGASVASHPDFQNMPQYATSSASAYHEQSGHGAFVAGAPPVSSAASDFHGNPRSLAPPAYNSNSGPAHFMAGQPAQGHPQQMSYREGATPHAYGYDA